MPQAIVDHVTAAAEHEHHVVWPRGNGELAQRTDLTIHPLGPSTLGRWFQIRASVRSIQPDLVIAHSTWAGLASALGATGGRPFFYQPHGLVSERPDFNLLLRKGFRIADRLIVSRAAGVICVGLAEHEQALRLDARSAHVVANVSHAHADVPTASHLPHLRVVTAGRISTQKDPGFYAETARAVIATNQDVEFVWIGDGDPRLQRVLEDAGVRVTGWVSQEESWRQMAGASAYLHSAVFEAWFPLTVLDAARLGIPLVLRAIPAFAEATWPMPRTPVEAAECLGQILSSPRVPHREVGANRPDAVAHAVGAAHEVRALASPERQRAAIERFYRDVTTSEFTTAGWVA